MTYYIAGYPLRQTAINLADAMLLDEGGGSEDARTMYALDARRPPGYTEACGASGFGLNCPSKASIFSVPQPFGSSQKVR